VLLLLHSKISIVFNTLEIRKTQTDCTLLAMKHATQVIVPAPLLWYARCHATPEVRPYGLIGRRQQNGWRRKQCHTQHYLVDKGNLVN
jgi:hypothetical protein